MVGRARAVTPSDEHDRRLKFLFFLRNNDHFGICVDRLPGFDRERHWRNLPVRKDSRGASRKNAQTCSPFARDGHGRPISTHPPPLAETPIGWIAVRRTRAATAFHSSERDCRWAARNRWRRGRKRGPAALDRRRPPRRTSRTKGNGKLARKAQFKHDSKTRKKMSREGGICRNPAGFHAIRACPIRTSPRRGLEEKSSKVFVDRSRSAYLTSAAS